MAQVTSGKDMTVIVLDNDEASALTDVLDSHRNFDARLDELTNAMISYSKHITVDDKNLVGSCEEGEEGWIGPGPVPTDWCGT